MLHAFTNLRLHRVEANIQPDNEASRRVAVANGFRLEGYSPRYLKIGGRWRDHERWCALADARPGDPERPAALATGPAARASRRGTSGATSRMSAGATRHWMRTRPANPSS